MYLKCFGQFFIPALFFILASCQSLERTQQKGARNAIFFIGDGMGPAQMTAARLYSSGSFGALNYEKMEVTGLSKTYSSREYTTDSAAAATALASAVKTYNGSIGMSEPEWEAKGRSRPLETILDLARASGKSVGIVTNTRLTHATPASFFAHVSHRNLESEIAEQILGSDVDLFIGGGRKYFLPENLGGKRKDGKNILELKKTEGSRVVSTVAELGEILDLRRPVLAVLGDDHIEYVSNDKRPIGLSSLVAKARNLLGQNPNGYVLIVEGGRIDHASHGNLAREALSEMLDLDRALGETLAAVDLKQTLVVLTADHETGGLAINGYGPHEKAMGEEVLGNTLSRDFSAPKKSILTWASGPGAASLYKMDSASHTAIDVIVAASGVGAHQFSGWMDNSDIVWKISNALGLKFKDNVNLNSRKALSVKKQMDAQKNKN